MMTEITIILIGIALFLAYKGLLVLADVLLEKIVNICASSLMIYNFVRMVI